MRTGSWCGRVMGVPSSVAIVIIVTTEAEWKGSVVLLLSVYKGTYIYNVDVVR